MAGLARLYKGEGNTRGRLYYRPIALGAVGGNAFPGEFASCGMGP